MSWLDSLEEVRKKNWSEAPLAERRAKAREVIEICSYAGAATAAVPLPVAELALLLPIHTTMVMTVGHVYGRKMSSAEAKEIVLELGAVAGLAFAGHAVIGALKRLLLPVVGGLISIPATFALTLGVGQLAVSYFEKPGRPREELKKIFEDAVAEGKSAFSKESFERFKQKWSESEEAKEKARPSEPPRNEPPKPEAPRAEAPKPEPPKKDAPPNGEEPPKRKKRTL